MLFFLLCLYVSLYYVRPFEWVPGLVGTPIFQVLGVISLLALLFAWGSGKIRLFQYKTDGIVLGFMIAIGLSHLRHGHFHLFTPSILTFLPAFIGYYLTVHALDSDKKIRKFMFLLILLASFLGYEAYVQGATGFAHGGMEPYLEHKYNDDGVRVPVPRVRWYGMFNDPNDLGLALVLVVPFLVNMVFERKYLLPSVCLPLLFYGLYLTNSRGGMLSLGASLWVYFVLRYRSVKGAVVGLMLVAALMTLGPSRMENLSANEASAHGRLDAWYEGYQMLKTYPIFGVGRGQYVDYHVRTAHNSYVLVMSELGLFGAFFFTGLFYYPLVSVKKIFFGGAAICVKDMGLVVATCASLVGLMIAMFFLSRSYILMPFMLCALLVKCSCQHHLGCESGAVTLPQNDFKKIFVILMLQIIFINIMVKILL